MANLQQHWIFRVGDGENFRNSKYPFWGVKRGRGNWCQKNGSGNETKGD